MWMFLCTYLQELGQLEVKHGLLQLTETLGFLHNNARLLHRAIGPEVKLHFFNSSPSLSSVFFPLFLGSSLHEGFVVFLLD